MTAIQHIQQRRVQLQRQCNLATAIRGNGLHCKLSGLLFALVILA